MLFLIIFAHIPLKYGQGISFKMYNIFLLIESRFKMLTSLRFN
jgi:hypothetical protein